jgi:hypothetical protein
MPSFRIGHTHTVALNACKAGITGEIGPGTVRAALVASHDANDILVDEDLLAALARFTRRRQASLRNPTSDLISVESPASRRSTGFRVTAVSKSFESGSEP